VRKTFEASLLYNVLTTYVFQLCSLDELQEDFKASVVWCHTFGKGISCSNTQSSVS